MKTKIAILILSVITVVSFTALTSVKRDKAQAKTYQSGGGHEMTDKGQFD